MERNIKTIALYLPQYHTIPENDEWWGKGFTEWTNVKKATPLYANHYQPKKPYNNNYYILDNTDIMRQQAKLAKESGIYGFCYYHYWFSDGKKLLEKPIEMMLQDKNVDIPFCLCWANESWTRNWDGGNKEVLMQQDYGNKSSWVKHIEYLIGFFKDDRYIRVDNNPVIVIYKPKLIPQFNEMISVWKQYVKEQLGVSLLVYSQYPIYNKRLINKLDLDGIIKFEPLYSYGIGQIKNIFISKLMDLNMGIRHENEIDIRDYDKAWKYILNKEPKGGKYIPGAFVDWDNTSRKRYGGVSYEGASPSNFFENYYALLKQIKSGKYTSDFCFINAWNEWAEGCYLEPDEKNQFGYLEAIKKANELIKNV